jgi:hypothetical protein
MDDIKIDIYDIYDLLEKGYLKTKIKRVPRYNVICNFLIEKLYRFYR